MSRKTSGFRMALSGLALLALTLDGPAVAQTPVVQAAAPQAAKWFVLRHGKTGYCQTALLVSIGGDYRSRSNLKAGGPFNTQDEALKEKQALEAEGICTKA